MCEFFMVGWILKIAGMWALIAIYLMGNKEWNEFWEDDLKKP
jgi:hypothetical protein